MSVQCFRLFMLDIFGLVLVRLVGFHRILVQDNLKQVCSRFRKYLSWYVCVCRCSSLWPEVRKSLLFHSLDYL